MPYDPTIYLGSAAHYRYGRPAYSPGLEAVLTQETGLDGTGRLLDAGCGPGVLTIRLAHLFEQAVGLDPDPGMLAEGRRAAGEKGIMNIRWVQGLAEDLPAVAPGPYKLVTFGQSFHWTDEQQVAETVYDMLEPGGALALIVHTVTGRPRPPDPGVPPIPHDEITTLVEKYLGSTHRAGQGTARERTHRFEDVLARTRFGVPQQFFVPGIPDLLRDSESVLSGYLSMSFSAPHLFGDRVDDFAGEVRALLASRSAEGIFWDWPGDTEVILARVAGPEKSFGWEAGLSKRRIKREEPIMRKTRHATKADAAREIRKPDEQWRRELTPLQYSVLRQAHTERPFAGEYVRNHQDGSYRCAGCGSKLFGSDAKFDSGTGWPSFSEPAVAEAVELRTDYSLFMRRTEVVCRRCGGHLGHVFHDGPTQTGDRYCINSCSLAFEPAAASREQDGGEAARPGAARG